MKRGPDRKPSDPPLRLAAGVPPLVILAAGLLVTLLVPPFGEFPLNDDWSFVLEANRLAERGTLRLLDWGAMSRVLQVAWGAAVIRLFGFGFSLLRLSTFLLGLGGILAFYGLLREGGAGRGSALLTALLLLFNPLYLDLSYTFMTDVPFLSLLLLSLLLYARGIARGRRALLFFASLAAAGAVLVRQWGILAPAAAGFALLGEKRRGKAKDLVAACALPLAALIAFHLWLTRVHGIPGALQWRGALLRPSALLRETSSLLEGAFHLALYLGLFLLPLLISLLPSFGRLRSLRPGQRGLALLLALIFIGGAVFGLLRGRAMPLVGNLLYNVGVGPLTLRDTYILRAPPPARWADGSWIAITLLAAAGAALLAGIVLSEAFSLFRRGRGGAGERAFSAFLFLSLLLSTTLIILTFRPVDRYFLVALPPAAVMVLSWRKRNRVKSSGAVCLAVFLPLALFAIVSLHDYMAWNRARWEGIRYLIDERGASPLEIDGGFEANGWFNYEALGGRSREGKSWWWVRDDRYTVTFTKLPGHRALREIPWRCLLAGRRRPIYVAERPDPDP